MSKQDNTTYWFGPQSYDKYIRIDSVSLDNGKTWKTDFPVTIPDTQKDDLMIRVSWRVSQKNDWTETQVVYPVKESCLYILRKKIENENEKIETDNILNRDDFSLGQYPEPGSQALLFRYSYMYGVLGEDDERMTSLFPGWTEGDSAPFWSYTTSTGRHILEPADMVPLDSKYIVKKKEKWMTEDLHVDYSAWNLCVLQTLTGLEGEFSLWNNFNTTVETLEVPKYIQAVEIAEGTPVTTDTLKIPDTVLYIDTNSPSMIIKKAYVVDAQNPNYASDAQGVLWNKEMTQLLGIPYECHTLEIPANTEKVEISYLNQLRRIIFDTDEQSTLPDIDFDNLNNCQLFIAKDRLLEFFEEKGSAATAAGCTISAIEEPEHRYSVQQDMALDQNGELFYVLSNVGANFTLPGDVQSIAENAFINASKVSTLILKNGEDLTLRENCLKNSHISQIICATQEQFANISSQLSAAGERNADGQEIEIQLSITTEDGFSYYTEGTGDEIKTTLIHVPQDLQSFDGTIAGGKVTVDAIGDGAFSGSEVQWVTLSEKTKTIGYRAFKNCEKLEGVLIDARDEITIGNQAFDDCPSLRFVASNALQATMEDGYDPLISDQYYNVWQGNNYFFVLPDAEGYGYNINTLWETPGIDHFEMISDAGQADARILYGVDMDDTPWLAVRSGVKMPANVNLPAETAVICDYAFADTTAAAGGYSVNWEDMTNLWWIQKGAFTYSEISGDIVIGGSEEDQSGTEIQIEDNVFAGCTGITGCKVMKTIRSLGEYVFSECSQLASVQFCSMGEWAALYSELFNGCEALRTLEIDAQTPPQLIINWNGPFCFNGYWTQEEQAEKLRIVVPESARKKYVVQWRYAMGGYVTSLFSDGSYLPAFRALWIDCYNELADSSTSPENKAVDALVKQKVLTMENNLRGMLGIDKVSEPTDLYIWHQNGDQLALGGVPSTIREVTLDPLTIDMPDVWYLDSVEADAFEGAKNLEKVTLLDNLSSIESNAFRGSAADSSQLTLHFEGTEPLQLIGGTKDEPFTFGVDEKKLHLDVPSGSEADYIKAWVYPLSGYTDEEEVLAEAKALLEKEDTGNSSASTEKAGSDTDSKEAADDTANEQTPAEEIPKAEPVTYSEDTSGTVNENEEPDNGDSETGETDDTSGKETDNGNTDNTGGNSGNTGNTPSEPTGPTENQIRRKAAELLLPTENRLRAMMGMKTLEGIDDGMLCMDVPEKEVVEQKKPEEENASVVPDAEVQTPEDAAASSDGLPETQPDTDGENKDQPETDTEPADGSASSLPETDTKAEEETEEKKSQNNSTGATPEAEAATGSRLKEGETE